METIGAPPLFPDNPAWPPQLHVEVNFEPPSVTIIKQHRLGRREVGSVEMTGPFEFPMLGDVRGVLESDLHEDYQDRGIGKAMYLIAMREFGPLHPDWTGEVSPEAVRVWRGLRGLPTVEHIAAEEVGVKIRWVRSFQGNHIMHITLPRADPRFVRSGFATWPPHWRGVLDQVYWIEDE